MMLDAQTIEDVYMSWHTIQQRTPDYETAFASVLDEQIAKLSPRMVEQLRDGSSGRSSRDQCATAHSRAVVKQLDMLVECLGPDQDDFIGIIKDVGRKHASSSASPSPSEELLTSRSCLLMGEAIIRTVAFFLDDTNSPGDGGADSVGKDGNVSKKSTASKSNNSGSSSRSWPHTQRAWNDLLTLVFSVMRKAVRRYEKKQSQKKELEDKINKSATGRPAAHHDHDDEEDCEIMDVGQNKSRLIVSQRQLQLQQQQQQRPQLSSSRRPQSSRTILQSTRKARSSRCLDVICRDMDMDNTTEEHEEEEAGDTESSYSDSGDHPSTSTSSVARSGTKSKSEKSTASKLSSSSRKVSGSSSNNKPALTKGQSKSMRNLFSSAATTGSSNNKSSSSSSSSKNTIMTSTRRLLGRVDEVSSSQSQQLSPTPGTPRRRRDKAVYCTDSPPVGESPPCPTVPATVCGGATDTATNRRTLRGGTKPTPGGGTDSASNRRVFALASPGLFRKSPQRTKSDMVNIRTSKGRQVLMNAAKIDL